MTQSIARALTLASALFLSLGTATVAAPAASPALTAAMHALNSLDAPAFTAARSWARQPGADFDSLTSPAGSVEESIALLQSDDEAAVISWLSADGRGALRARGLTDSVIGAARWNVDLWGDAPFGAAVVTESGQRVVTEDGRGIVTGPVPCFTDSKVGGYDDGHCFTDYHPQQ